MTATISEGRLVLACDGTTALVGTSAGVTLLDLLNQPAHYRLSLALPEAPLSASLVDEQLLLLSTTAAMVMSVPCLR